MNELYLNRSAVRIALLKRDDAEGLKAIDALTILTAEDISAHAPKTRKPHPGADGEAVLGEINRIASMPETEVLDLARKERLDLRLVLATQIVEERSFYGDFCPDSPERVAQEALCERMARAEGWRDAGLMFKHQTKNAYLKSDMDGWRDLCSNEGILP